MILIIFNFKILKNIDNNYVEIIAFYSIILYETDPFILFSKKEVATIIIIIKHCINVLN